MIIINIIRLNSAFDSAKLCFFRKFVFISIAEENLAKTPVSDFFVAKKVCLF